MMTVARRMWGSIMLGLYLGLVGGQVLTGLSGLVVEHYDDWRPVVKITGERVGAESNAVLLRLRGTKHRECEYLRLTAFTSDAGGRLTAAYINRESKKELGETLPRGTYEFGTWRLWPIDSALRAVVYISHQCGDRIVRTKVADVAL